MATGRRPPPKRSLLCYKGGYPSAVCNAVDQWLRSQCFGAETYLDAALIGLITFNFGITSLEAYCDR